MTKEIILSEKKLDWDAIGDYLEKDIKKAIKRLKEELMNSCENKADGLLIHKIIDKIFGEELSK